MTMEKNYLNGLLSFGVINELPQKQKKAQYTKLGKKFHMLQKDDILGIIHKDTLVTPSEELFTIARDFLITHPQYQGTITFQQNGPNYFLETVHDMPYDGIRELFSTLVDHAYQNWGKYKAELAKLPPNEFMHALASASGELVSPKIEPIEEDIREIKENLLIDHIMDFLPFYGFYDEHNQDTPLGLKFHNINEKYTFALMLVNKETLMTVSEEIFNIAKKFANPDYLSFRETGPSYVIEVRNKHYEHMKELLEYLINYITENPLKEHHKAFKPKSVPNKKYDKRDMPRPAQLLYNMPHIFTFFNILDEQHRETEFGKKFFRINEIKPESLFFASQDILISTNPNVFRLAKQFLEENPKYKTKLNLLNKGPNSFHMETVMDDQGEGITKLFRYLVNTIDNNPGILKGKKY